MEIEQLSLDKPVITFTQNDKNQWNYEAVGAKGSVTNPAPRVVKPASPAPQPATRAKTEVGTPLDIVLSKLAITQGAVSLVSDKNKPIVSVNGINFSSSLSLIDNKLAGSGKTGIDKINLSNTLFVEKVATTITLAADQVTLAPLSGKLADGALSGNVAVKFSNGLQYNVNLQAQDVDVAKLLQDAGSKPVMSGKLKATTTLEGTGGLPTIVGNGRAEIDGGHKCFR